MKHIDPKRHPRLHAVAQGAKWAGQDAYPAWPSVADENEEWLKLVEMRLGQAGLDHYTNKLRETAAKRNEFLVELATAYFLDTRCGLPIVGLEPAGAGGKTGEFLFGLPDGRQMFVEVKSPGWEGEVEEDERGNRVGPRPKGRLPRLNQPKYRDLEGRAFHHTQRVRDTVAKANPKMLDTLPTLLIISDDLFVSLTDSLDMAKWALFAKRSIDPSLEAAKYQPRWTTEDGCFLGSRYERLGAVGVLNFVPGKPYRYLFALFLNPHALDAVRVPAEPFADYPLFEGPDWPEARPSRSWLPFVLGAVGVTCLTAALVWWFRRR
jgi:hypothetical protein